MSARTRNAFTEYFANLWAGIVTTCVGMCLTLRYFFSKPVTMLYPEERPEVPAGHRGLHGYEESKCIACKMCVAACPVVCIKIEMVGRGKDALITRYEIDYSKCIFCELCVAACPTQCLWMTEVYDLSCTSRQACRRSFARAKTPEDIAAHERLMVQKEAEKKAQAAEAARKKAVEAKTQADKTE